MGESRSESGSEYRFDADTQVVHEGATRWSARIGPAWSNYAGTPNGGYLLTVALAAVRHPCVDGKRLMTATAHFLRPGLAGRAELDVVPLKDGRGTSTVSVALAQQGKERVRVLATYGAEAAWTGPAERAIEPPALPGPDGCVAPPTAVHPPPGLHLLKRYDYRVPATRRWAAGPHQDEHEKAERCPVLDGWIRFSDGREPDLAALPVIADAFPPALSEIVVEAEHVATVEMTVHIRADPKPGWIQTHTESRHLAGRLVEEDTYLWDVEGTLVAMARQLALRPAPVES